MIETVFFILFVVIEIVVFELRTNSYCVVSFNKDVIAEGAERTTSNGYKYCAYTGIRYARPPNRFEVVSLVVFILKTCRVQSRI